MKKVLLLTLCGILSACSVERVSNFPSYKLTIQQGNQINHEALAQLQPGLTKTQVQNLLGTPALQDPFHADRWDYAFAVTKNGIMKESKNLTVFFENDVVVNITGSVPSEEETEALVNKY